MTQNKGTPDNLLENLIGGGVSIRQQLKYDYSLIAAESRDQVQRAAVEIIKSGRTAKQSMIDMGVKLLEVKDLLEHGQFSDWCEQEFSLSQRMAQNMMNVAREFGGKNETVSLLTDSVLIALAAPSTPEAARAAVIEKAQATGKSPTKAEAQAIIIDHKPDAPKNDLGDELTEALIVSYWGDAELSHFAQSLTGEQDARRQMVESSRGAATGTWRYDTKSGKVYAWHESFGADYWNRGPDAIFTYERFAKLTLELARRRLQQQAKREPSYAAVWVLERTVRAVVTKNIGASDGSTVGLLRQAARDTGHGLRRQIEDALDSANIEFRGSDLKEAMHNVASQIEQSLWSNGKTKAQRSAEMVPLVVGYARDYRDEHGRTAYDLDPGSAAHTNSTFWRNITEEWRKLDLEVDDDVLKPAIKAAIEQLRSERERQTRAPQQPPVSPEQRQYTSAAKSEVAREINKPVIDWTDEDWQRYESAAPVITPPAAPVTSEIPKSTTAPTARPGELPADLAGRGWELKRVGGVGKFYCNNPRGPRATGVFDKPEDAIAAAYGMQVDLVADAVKAVAGEPMPDAGEAGDEAQAFEDAARSLRVAVASLQRASEYLAGYHDDMQAGIAVVIADVQQMIKDLAQ